MSKRTTDRIELTIRPPRDGEWDEIAGLLAESVPHALVSSLGRRFGALYYRHIARPCLSCSYAAFDRHGQLAGIVLGTLDHNASEKLPFFLLIRLLLAAHVRLFSPTVFRWLSRGVPFKKAQKDMKKDFPPAELKFIAVSGHFQGNGVAGLLIDALENFFRDNDLAQPYLIRTEKGNHAGNSFYEKIGADFIGTYAYHDKLINEWHKTL